MSHTPRKGSYGVVSLPTSNHILFGRKIKLPNWMGLLIMLFQMTPRNFWSRHWRFSHAFIYIGDGKIVEAESTGARVADLSEYDGCDIEWFDTISLHEAYLIMWKALDLVGTGYGFADIFAIGLHRLGFKPRWLDNQVRREDRVICSQLVAMCGAYAGVNWLCGQPSAQLVRPVDLASRI